jgi:hypothetical protein
MENPSYSPSPLAGRGLGGEVPPAFVRRLPLYPKPYPIERIFQEVLLRLRARE